MAPTPNKKLQLAVYETLNQDAMAISLLMKELRMSGWRGLGNLSHFEEILEVNGFRLERIYKKPHREGGAQILEKTYVHGIEPWGSCPRCGVDLPPGVNNCDDCGWNIKNKPESEL